MKITKTTNPIHFEDLDPMRFEDLAFNILYRIKKWHSINHLGKSGNDGGIDIDGTEINEDTSITKWLIQCKRYQKIGPKLIESIIRELNEKNPNFEYLHLIISCPLSRTGHQKLDGLKLELGVKEILIWTNSHLEAMLYHEFPDLLNIYFGIKTGTTFDEKLALLEKRKSYRNHLKSELLKPFDPSVAIFGPKTFHHRKFIIRSVMDDDYETFTDPFGWSSYFAVQPYEIGDLGITVNLCHDFGFIDNNGKIIITADVGDNEKRTFARRCLIPYENIATYDLDNGQCRPMLYCIYKGEKGPFTDMSWELE